MQRSRHGPSDSGAPDDPQDAVALRRWEDDGGAPGKEFGAEWHAGEPVTVEADT